jgi:superfamily II DNA helicase RecQ
MNIKVFNIRLAKEFCQHDQDKMNEFLDEVEVKLTSTNFVTNGNTDFWSAAVFYMPKNSREVPTKTKISEEDLSENERNIFNALRQWRNSFAQKLNWSSFRVCHNSHLIAIAKSNPHNLEELENVSGFGKSRTEKYGDEILSVLHAL